MNKFIKINTGENATLINLDRIALAEYAKPDPEDKDDKAILYLNWTKESANWDLKIIGEPATEIWEILAQQPIKEINLTPSVPVEANK